MMLIDDLLTQYWIGFAMLEISWGRSDQFGDFMTVLKLGAVDFNDSARITDERLRGGFCCACLPGARGAPEARSFRSVGRAAKAKLREFRYFEEFREQA
jgi:hypothetical protein